jgi:hypothetical protein
MASEARKWKGNALGGGNGDRGDYLNSIRERLRALFPDSVDHAREKRAELLSYAAGEALGRPEVRDVAAAADLPLAELEKLWRVVDGVLDAH